MTQETPKQADSDAPTTETATGLENAPSAAPPAAGTPRTIGRYHIRQLIDSGGMGKVYLAVQEQPRRTVALKVMRQGIASRSALRRFEFESQILARLKHPFIADVYEAGTHDDGSGGVPYFAMEYIPNAKTIIEYAVSKRLGNRERLALFAKVCEAVHHGHQKGVIHRDLKPGNILVASDGNPKIIDFGVARSTDSDMAITTLQTDIGQLIGTLQYMSPEQCEADPHDIDTRSDVYALGVVLYELLCNQLPYDVSKLAIHEAARIIQEQLPTRPSTISRTLRGDIETITLKAMEKDRERRYRSAIDLSDDIHRYLNNEPIEARPASALYQLGRFAARHRTGVIAVSAVVFVLVAGVLVTTAILYRAQRREAVILRAGIENVEAVVEFVEEMFRESSANVLGHEPTFREVLDVGTARVDRGVLEEHPSAEAAIRRILGEAYRTNELESSAEANFRRALELHRATLSEPTAETAMIMARLAMVARDRPDAEANARESLRLFQNFHGQTHENVAVGWAALAEVLYIKGDFAGSESALREAGAVHQALHPEGSVAGAVSMRDLSWVLREQGKYDESERLAMSALEDERRLLGETHSHIAASYRNLARLHRERGDLEKAAAWFERETDVLVALYGAEHPRIARVNRNLGRVRAAQERWPQAERCFRELLRIGQVIELDSFLIADGNHRLGEALIRQTRLEEAEALLLISHDRFIELLRDSEDDAGLPTSSGARRREATLRYVESVRQLLASLYDNLGRQEEAERWRALPAWGRAGAP